MWSRFEGIHNELKKMSALWTNWNILCTKMWFFVNIVLTMYSSFLCWNYAILSWRATELHIVINPYYSERLKVHHYITKASNVARWTPLFAKVKVLKFNNLYHLNMVKFMISTNVAYCLPVLIIMFTLASSVHSHDTCIEGRCYANNNWT